MSRSFLNWTAFFSVLALLGLFLAIWCGKDPKIGSTDFGSAAPQSEPIAQRDLNDTQTAKTLHSADEEDKLTRFDMASYRGVPLPGSVHEDWGKLRAEPSSLRIAGHERPMPIARDRLMVKLEGASTMMRERSVPESVILALEEMGIEKSEIGFHPVRPWILINTAGVESDENEESKLREIAAALVPLVEISAASPVLLPHVDSPAIPAGELFARLDGMAFSEFENELKEFSPEASIEPYSIVPDTYLIEGADATGFRQLEIAATLASLEGVKYVEPNLIMHGETSSVPSAPHGDAWALKNTGQSGGVAGFDLNAEAAWTELGNGGDEDIEIAIFDDGIERTHPGLTGRVLLGVDFTSESNLGYGGSPGSAFDTHGTQVAGCIVGVENGKTLGIAPGCRVRSARIFITDSNDNKSFESLWLANALLWAAAEDNIRIANHSYGFSQEYANADVGGGGILRDIFNSTAEEGLIHVGAIGNSNLEGAEPPSLYQSVIGVGASQRNGVRWRTGSNTGRDTGSNFASECWLVAPGSEIRTTDLTTGSFLGSFGQVGGTSLSSPFVAGVVGLMLSKNDSLTTSDVWNILASASKPIFSDESMPGVRLNPFNIFAGHGQIDSAKALRLIDQPAHTGVTATDGTRRTGIGVRWVLDSDNLGFFIYRNTRNDFASASQLGSDDLLFQTPVPNAVEDHSAKPGIRYFYWVKTSLTGVFGQADSGYRSESITPSEALDTPGQHWTRGGPGWDDAEIANPNPDLISLDPYVPWFTKSHVSSDRNDAMQSGPIGNNEVTHLSTRVEGPADVSFQWKVSSEQGKDYARFYVDDEEQSGVAAISGDLDWATVSGVRIPAGSHLLTWTYEKDEVDSEGEDAAWLDQVIITPVIDPTSAGPESLTITPNIENPIFGDALTLTASATDPSGTGLTFEWYDEAPRPNAVPVQTGSQRNMTVDFDNRVFYVKAINQWGAATVSRTISSHGTLSIEASPLSDTTWFAPTDFRFTVSPRPASLIGYTFDWDFGNGVPDTGSVVEGVHYANPGTYNVTVTVTKNGVSQNLTRQITILDATQGPQGAPPAQTSTSNVTSRGPSNFRVLFTEPSATDQTLIVTRRGSAPSWGPSGGVTYSEGQIFGGDRISEVTTSNSSGYASGLSGMGERYYFRLWHRYWESATSTYRYVGGASGNAVLKLGGTLNYDLTLTTANSPYEVDSDLTIPPGAKLTVPAGVVVKNAGRDIRVEGELEAVGSVFTSWKDDSAGGDSNEDGSATLPAADDWGVISFEDGSTGLLDGVRVSYGSRHDSSSISLDRWGMVSILSDGVEVRNSIIRDGGYRGIWVTDSSPLIVGNQIQSNGSEGILIRRSASNVIGNTVVGNRLEGVELDESPSAVVTGNAVRANYLGASAPQHWHRRGIWVDASSVNATLAGNVGTSVVTLSGGQITIDKVLDNHQVWYLESDLKVSTGAKLTVPAGVVVKSAGRDIRVVGELEAVGSVFTSWKDDSAGGDSNEDGSATLPAADDWGVISFEDGSTGLLDGVRVSYGSRHDSSSISLDRWGMVSILSDGVEVRNSIIRDGGYRGIWVTDSSPLIVGNQIQSNGSEGILIRRSASNVIGNTVVGNRLEGVELDESPSAVVTGNAVRANYLGASAPQHWHRRGVWVDASSVNATLAGNVGTSVVTLSGGQITIDKVLDNHQVWYLASDLRVSTGAKLTVPSGVVVKSAAGRNIWVDGELEAVGSVFTSWKDDSAGGDSNEDGSATLPAADDWGVISFEDGSTGLLDGVRVSYGSRHDSSSISLDRWGMVSILSDGVEVRNSIIRDGGYRGIWVTDSSPLIVGNQIQSNGSEGIWIRRSASNVVGNTVVGNRLEGVELDESPSAVVTGNAVRANYLGASAPQHWHRRGIWVDASSVNATLAGNVGTSVVTLSGGQITIDKVLDNHQVWYLASDLRVSTGAKLTVPSGVVVKSAAGRNIWVDGELEAVGSVFTSWKDDSAGGDSNEDGSATLPAADDWGVISFEDGSTGLLDGVRVSYGSRHDSSSSSLDRWGMVSILSDGVEVRNSIIRDGGYRGIWAVNSQLTLNNNLIENNNDDGIYLSTPKPGSIVSFNTIRNNSDEGIYVTGSPVTLRHNTIENNGGYGVYSSSASSLVDAANNHWGDATGPFHATLNPSGLGDIVSNYVDISPWGTTGPPTDILLSSNSIQENQPAGSIVGTLSAVDETPGETFSFSLVPGFGSSGNADFSISGNQLVSGNSFDYESVSSRSVRVRVTDSSGGAYEEVFTISITDDRSEDSDGDGLTEEQEEDIYGTSDNDADWDNDGYDDGFEAGEGTNLKDGDDVPTSEGRFRFTHTENPRAGGDFFRGSASNSSLSLPIEVVHPGPVTLTVNENGFSSAQTVTVEPTSDQIVLPTLSYDGSGNAGIRTFSINSSQALNSGFGEANIVAVPEFEFSDAGEPFLISALPSDEEFVADTARSGEVTIPIQVTHEGDAVFELTGNGFSCSDLVAIDQDTTEVTLSVNYDGTGNAGTFTMAVTSSHAVGDGVADVQATIYAPLMFFTDAMTAAGLSGADAEEDADPDGDGFTNLEEWAEGAHAGSPDSTPKRIVKIREWNGESWLTMAYLRRTDSVESGSSATVSFTSHDYVLKYEGFVSASMDSWSSSAAHWTEPVNDLPPPPPLYEWGILRLDLNVSQANHRFMKLVVYGYNFPFSGL